MAEQNNLTEKGGISVETAHIFPIIKRWLYSEKDIFLREIVSNAADAITKMKRLCSLGEAECHDDYKIFVSVDKTAGTLTVEDNGIGMPEESLEHIYERFYRVDKSHSREIGGIGLGLAITRNSILMHRGAIKVYSVLDEGTTFDVRIPLNYIA